MSKLFISYLAAFVAANLLVKHFGPFGLWFSSFILIPFDFVVRCIIHEKYSGFKLIIILFSLTVGAGVITIFINFNAFNVALASVIGFVSAQIGAGVFYQLFKKRSSYFFKVNISDLIAIILDSLVFQIIAFGAWELLITGGQIAIKFTGGLIWYYILFKKLKIQRWIKESSCQSY